MPTHAIPINMLRSVKTPQHYFKLTILIIPTLLQQHVKLRTSIILNITKKFCVNFTCRCIHFRYWTSWFGWLYDLEM